MALIAPEESGAGGTGEWWAEFNIFEDRDGRYHWRLEAATGRIIPQPRHPCESKYWYEQDVNWLRANARLIMVCDHTGVPHQPSV